MPRPFRIQRGARPIAAGACGPDVGPAASGLAEAVTDSVVPRLLLALGAEAVPGLDPALAGSVAALRRHVLAAEDDQADSLVAALLAVGVTAERLHLDLLAPVARELGELWVADELDVAQVTLGVGRLRRLMHALGRAFHADDVVRLDAPRILLGLAPGEQHGFGLAMLAAFFRRAGWQVTVAEAATQASLVSLAASQAFDVAGLSIAADRHVDALANCIPALRAASRNPAIGIMLGGPAVLRAPDLALRLGADATATDGRSAPGRAERLLALKRRERPLARPCPQRPNWPEPEELITLERVARLPQPEAVARHA